MKKNWAGAGLRWAVAGIASAALVVSGCGQIPESELNPVAMPAVASTPAAAPTPEPTPTPEPSPEPTPVETPKALPTPSVSATPTTRATKAAPQATKTAPKATRTPTASPTPSPKPTLQAGPAIMEAGDSSDRVKELQARLKQINWFSGSVTGYYGTQTTSSVAGFQTKRGLPSNGSVDQTTWDRLVGMTRKPTADELSNKPKAEPTGSSTKKADSSDIDQRCMTGRVICISKKTNTLRWMNDGNVRMTMDVRFGTSEYPTREGTFSVQWKSRDHVSTIYHTSMPYALFFSGGQAVHYSSDFAARGYNGSSHGCVNVRDKEKVATLFDAVSEGDKVVVY